MNPAFRAPGSNQDDSCLSPFRERNGDILSRPRPARLSDIYGQSPVVRRLSAFAAAPHSNAFIFAGSSGVGKTAAAWALANELGCDPDWGGVVEIPSGTQDGRAVEDLLRRMHLRPMAGSGWKVVIINEADRMTPQAEVMWLDGLRMEKAPVQDGRRVHHEQPSQADRPLHPPLRSPAVRRDQRRFSATAWWTRFARSGSERPGTTWTPSRRISASSSWAATNTRSGWPCSRSPRTCGLAIPCPPRLRCRSPQAETGRVLRQHEGGRVCRRQKPGLTGASSKRKARHFRLVACLKSR